MHFKGTNLNLKGHSVPSDYRGMKGLVHIGLRHSDIILKAPGNRGIELVNKAQHRITVLYRIHDNADGKQIIDLVYGLVLVYHLLVNGEEVLDSSFNVGSDAGLFDMLPHLLHNLVDSLFPNLSFKMYLLRQIVIHLRLQVFQGQVVHLNLNLADTQTIRQRRINLQGLSGLFLSFLRTLVFQSTQIMQAIRQLDDDDPDILGHGYKHLSEILRLQFNFIGI